jgi:hypothetical protein
MRCDCCWCDVAVADRVYEVWSGDVLLEVCADCVGQAGW